MIAEAKTPNVNLNAAKTTSELVTPAKNDEQANPKIPSPSIHLLFHLFEKSLMKILEQAYVMPNMSDAIIP